jgi:hypothetical protein
VISKVKVSAAACLDGDVVGEKTWNKDVLLAESGHNHLPFECWTRRQVHRASTPDRWGAANHV